MAKLRKNGFERSRTELDAVLTSFMMRRGYDTVMDFSRRVSFPLNYIPLLNRLRTPTSFKIDELFMFANALQIPAEDFGEMCKNAYSEFKKV